jgi:hypothetical protein
MSAPTDTLTETPDIAAPAPIEPGTENTPEDRPRGFQWGQRKDGSPRRKPGRPRKTTGAAGAGSGSSRTTRPGRPAAAPKPAAPKGPTARKRTDYTTPLGQLLGIILTPLGMFFPLDVMAIGMRAEEIVTVGNELANDVPIIGEYLDKYVKVGPYAAGLSLVVSLGAQVAHNHGKVPEQAVVMLGGIPRTKLIAMRQQQQAAAAAAAAEEQARFNEAMAGMGAAA